MPNGEVSRRFPHSYASAGEARRFVAETFGGWGLHQLVADACLVASELVTNVVRHARSDIAVALSRVPGAARVAVGDADPRPPIRRDPSPSVPDGRGLKVVEALARRWGCEAVPGGKVVWADLPLDVDRATASPA
jgi:anti-sigma regulatory factor (Ser/Thr protein kinase)